MKTTELQSILTENLPLLPLRDVVLFPHMVMPLFVGRDKSTAAVEKAQAGNKKIILSCQKNDVEGDIMSKDIHRTGCVANILQILKLPDGTLKVLVEGLARVKITKVQNTETMLSCHAELLPEEINDDESYIAGLRRTILNVFDEYVKLSKKVPQELAQSLNNIQDLSRLCDTMTSHLAIDLPKKQDVLELIDLEERITYITEVLEAESELFQVEKKIRNRVKKQLEKNQKEYHLNEQIKAIQKELGENDEELDKLEEKIRQAKMSKEAQTKALAELKKLKMMSSMSSEASVIRTYIDTLIGLPWAKMTKADIDMAHAAHILDEDHFGLDKVKERVLEFLAVQKRSTSPKAPILCLVGAPGVGKTSMGESIARATNRKFVRMALGGVRDEAEMRGHRRTYIGAMPGKILQNLTKVGVHNPLFLLDEVDKMGMDHRGDPASALLEILDPEQNKNFSDHYLEVDFDLSKVLFIATSNSLNIPAPLLDRMEIIRIAGYTEQEKIEIAKKYLLSKQMKNSGVKSHELIIDESVFQYIVRYYTRESGVRGLEKEIGKICRKVTRELLESTDKNINCITVNLDNVEKYLGVKKCSYGIAEQENQIGQVTGLAWTEVGGELLTIEAVSVDGKGKNMTTGKLGDVMQESIKAAMTVVRKRAAQLGISADFYEKKDIHIHVPEGATPKDGPSAGIAMTTALVSVLTDIPVRCDVAMTGEITLRGEVLAIGGLKEKLLAAHRGGIKTVMIPYENAKDLVEIPDNIKNELDVIPVRWIDEVLKIALERQPTPLVIATAEKHEISIPKIEAVATTSEVKGKVSKVKKSV